MRNFLSYTRMLSVNPDRLHEAICNAQLEYFKHYSKKIVTLEEGLKISRDFYTKINNAKVRGKSVLAVLNENEIVLKHVYGDNTIESAWRLEPGQEGVRLTYQETNDLADASKQRNFALVSLVYQFFFRRQTKKRFDYLVAQCQKSAWTAQTEVAS